MFTTHEIRTNDLIFELARLNERLEGVESEILSNSNDLSLKAAQTRSFNRLQDKRYSMLIELKALIYAEIEGEELSDSDNSK